MNTQPEEASSRSIASGVAAETSSDSVDARCTGKWWTRRHRGRQRVPDKMRAPYILAAALAALMVVQSVLGLPFQEQYRDAGWIKATWFGNDWVTLAVAVPLLVVALLVARQGSRAGSVVMVRPHRVRRLQRRLLSIRGCP